MPSSRSDMPSGGWLKSPTMSMGLLIHPCSFASANMTADRDAVRFAGAEAAPAGTECAVAAPLLGRGHAPLASEGKCIGVLGAVQSHQARQPVVVTARSRDGEEGRAHLVHVDVGTGFAGCVVALLVEQHRPDAEQGSRYIRQTFPRSCADPRIVLARLSMSGGWQDILHRCAIGRCASQLEGGLLVDQSPSWSASGR